MTRVEHLLTKVAEEATEVAQGATKALSFGLTEVQPGQDLTNARRMEDEFYDLLAIMFVLQDEGHLPKDSFDEAREKVQAKKQKFEKFFEYSKSRGTVTEPTRDARKEPLDQKSSYGIE